MDVVHATAFSCPDVGPARLAVTIYDLTYHLFPELHLRSNIEFCERNMARAVAHGDVFLAISEQTRKDFVSRYGVDEERVRVVHLAAAPMFVPTADTEKTRRVLASHGIHESYVLFVGSAEPRKNIATLIKAFAALVADGRLRDHVLVLAGTPGWLNDELHGLPASLGVRERVKFLGYVDDEALPVLYSAAEVFVYPSLYEGFGLPVLEAMSCGAPVITSNVSSLPEVAGDAGVLVDPRDADALARAMATVLRDPGLIASMRVRSRARAQSFSLERMARDTVRAYESFGDATARRAGGRWRALFRTLS